MKRLTFIWANLAAFAVTVIDKGVVLAQAAASLPQQIVNQLYANSHGPYPGFRANHAKGIVCQGTFTPSAEAPSLSSAAHFQKPVKVTARFSDVGGVPTVPDYSDDASPHGFAVKFHLPDGTDTDIVGISVPLFPVATAEDFLALLKAAGSGPSAIGPFLASHPYAAKFVQYPKPPPVSFATLSYFYINAFKLTNAKGESHYVRYEMRAIAPAASLTADQAKQKGPKYLQDELKKRLSQGPAEFDYIAQIAEPGDPTDNATLVWPATRKTVVLGRLTLSQVDPNSDAVQRKLLFDPARVTPGIAASGDPLIPARSQAYAISYVKRLTG